MRKLFFLIAFLFSLSCDSQSLDFLVPNVDGSTETQRIFRSSLVLDIEPHLTKRLKQEANVGESSNTAVTAQSDPVGFVQDVAHGFTLASPSAGTRPLFGMGDGRNAYFIYDGANDWWIGENMKGFMRTLVGPNPTGSIMIWFKTTADATTYSIISSNDATASRTGVTLGRNSSNKATLNLTKNSPNTTLANHTSTGNVLSSGWHALVYNFNGAGTGTLDLYIDGVFDSESNIAAGVLQDNTDNFVIGQLSNSQTNDFSGYLGHVIFLDRPATLSEIAWFQTYNPPVDFVTSPFVLHSWYDYTDASTMYEERTNPTTNVSTNGDPIGYMFNKVTYTYGDLDRDAVAPTDPKRVTYSTTELHGYSTGYWDGEATKQELNFARWPAGGTNTYLVIQRYANDSAPFNEGRKVMSNGQPGLTGGDKYFTITSEGDPSTLPTSLFGAVPGQGFFVLHPGGEAYGQRDAARDNKTTAFLWVVDGTSISVYNAAKEKRTFTLSGSAAFLKMGGIAGTWTNDYIPEIKLWVGLPGGSTYNQDEAANKIMDEVIVKYQITTP